MIEHSTEAKLAALAAQVGQRLLALGLMVAPAESCTGGWVAKTLTDVAGSSAWLDRGFVTYSNAAKVEMLGVSAETLDAHGAVSEAVVREMVRGALQHSCAQVAVAISGIAGPGGGTADKAVGTVWLAWGREGSEPVARRRHFAGDREQVRAQSVEAALDGLLALL
ncbi:nicotinamide-nucleotide amidase [Thiorhodococcus mannitoliphagus]|uniref:Nicotinamide-nucleotide amidase n=1 Tax=Thiorhodococcus mannitoliphagus TaxID=329406 RepID=A0A6P1E250_9GAMM|nr:nicotinamide-nucleotide amidase [Thiorhodococcus mannitoliphagus]NEX21775.1 nicotinamide-nucleotide amidase [Thiorhodococcus mannitoliphagus]